MMIWWKKPLQPSDRISQIYHVLKCIVYLSSALGLSATFVGCGTQVNGGRFLYGLRTNDFLFQSLVVSNIFAFAASSGALMIRDKDRWKGVFFLYSFFSLLCMAFSLGILLYSWGSVNYRPILGFLSAIWM